MSGSASAPISPPTSVGGRGGAPGVRSAHESGSEVAREYWFELLIAVLAIAGMLELVVGRDSPGAPATWLWFSVPAVAVLVLPLFARRRFPFAAPSPTGSWPAALTFVDGLLIPFIGSLGVVGLATAFLLGNLRDDRQAGVGLAIVLGCIVVVVANIPGPQTVEPARLHPTAVRGRLGRRLRPARAGRAGRGGGDARSLAEREREAAEMRAMLAEREREAAARVAVAEERARIARELHDIVAHAISVMVLQVGAVRHNLPQALEEDREALGRVEQAGRTALARCAACSERCAATATASSSAPSPASTASTRWSTTSAEPDFQSDYTWTATRPAPARDRPVRLSNRAGRPDQRPQTRPRPATPT